MGNNPSRHQHQQSTSSSAFASPPNAPSRAQSSAPPRRSNFRRNSLHSPASVKYSTPTSQEFSTTARPRQQYEGVSADYLIPSDYRYLPPRRESIAETISEGYNAFPTPTREELLEDAATLRLFPSPPTSQMVDTAPTPINNAPFSPFAPGINPFGQSIMNQQQAGEGMRQGRGSIESTAASIEEDMPPESDARAVPTLIQWPHPGIKVYVTGTFCAWEKRYRLTQNPDDNIISAVVAIPPGTHHVKFLVDGEMRTSPALPTAVDDTGILVNYLEVSSDDMPPLGRQLSSNSQSGNVRATDSSERIPPTTLAESQLQYTTEIPTYLKDFTGGYNDDDLVGASYADDAPPPPSLPMMLQKVILNTSNQMKDDASVLSIPNHAVLNHLATSSIKNSILAVSATTRYKKKYVTTILYKAASAQED